MDDKRKVNKQRSSPSTSTAQKLLHGQVFSTAKIHQMLSSVFPGTVKNEAAVFLTSVLEFVGSKIIEGATKRMEQRAGENQTIVRSRENRRGLKLAFAGHS
ncbi:unnamed protein product [Larinioides sclopetarius]|uniref:Histone H2A n=1 Tax=Larinioides sclopetarius TaxID=280406 RepID=A0AAV1ZD13_9ARAC